MALLSPAVLRRLSKMSLRSASRSAGRGAGDLRSSGRGQSQEFADHRPYVPGDDLRFVDWHLMARHDAIWVKLFEGESDRTVQLMLDSSASMGGEKLDYARRIAAGLAWISLGRRDRVMVAALSDKLAAYSPPRRGRGAASSVFKSLENIRPGGGTGLSAALAECPRQRGASVVCLFSDLLFDDALESVLGRLRVRGTEVHLFHVLSAADLRPELHGDIVVVDSETREEVAITVDSAALDRYEAHMRSWAEERARICRRLGIGYTGLFTRVPAEDVLLYGLREAGVVGR